MAVISPYTGAVPRTNNWFGGDLPTPADFGVSGDGVTDCTADFQAIIDSSNVEGLFIPQYAKYVLSNLNISRPFAIVGVQNFNPNLAGDNAGRFMRLAGATGPMITLSKHCRFEGVFVDGNKANAPNASPLIFAKNAAYTHIEALVMNGAGVGIEIQNYNASSDADEGVIGSNTRVTGCNGHGIKFSYAGASSQGVGDWTIEAGARSESNGGCGLQINGGSANYIDGQYLSNTSHGIEAISGTVPVTRLQLGTGVRSRNNGGSGLYVHGSGGAAVKVNGGQYHYNNAAAGSSNNIDIFNVARVSLIGAYAGDRDFTYRCAYGVQLDTCTEVTMVDNDAADNTNRQPLLTSCTFAHYEGDGYASRNTAPNFKASTGYVDNFDDHTFANIDNEWRGNFSTLRYYRTTSDEATLGWDVFVHGGALVLDGQMNLPGGDRIIRGNMKVFASELYFAAPVNPYTANWAYNYEASIAQIASGVTVATYAAFVVTQPPSGGVVTNGYGLWVQNLDSGGSTFTHAAAIKIDGVNDYGQILWPALRIYDAYAAATHTAVVTAYDGTNYVKLALDGSVVGLAANSAGSVGVGILNPSTTAWMHFAAGTTAKVPLRFTSGSLKTAAVDGSMEWDGSNLFFTQGGVRKVLNPLTSKGQLYTHDSSGTVAIGPGTNGYVLSADSTATPGLAWISIAGAAGAWALVGNATAGVSTLGTTNNHDVSLIANNVEQARLLAAGGFQATATLYASAGIDSHNQGIIAGSLNIGASSPGTGCIDASLNGNFNSLAINGTAVITSAKAIGNITGVSGTGDFITSSGHIGCTTGYYIGATQIVDGSRNIANVVAITCSSTLTVGGAAAITGACAAASYAVGATAVIDGSRNIVNAIAITCSSTLTVGGGAAITGGCAAGSYAVGATTVIDSSRNIGNVLAITASGLISTGGAISATGDITSTGSFVATSGKIKIKEYGGGWPLAGGQEIATWFDGSNMWLVFDDGNKWKIQFVAGP